MTHPSSPGFPQESPPGILSGPRPHGGSNQRAFGSRLHVARGSLRHAVRRNAGPRTRRSAMTDASNRARLYIREPRPPFTSTPSPFRAPSVWGGASLGRSRLSTSATRLQHTGTSTRVASSAPAARPRTPHRVDGPQAFAERELSRSTPSAARRHRTTLTDLPGNHPPSCEVGPGREPGAITDRTTWSEGSAAFWAYCGRPSSEAGRASLCRLRAATRGWRPSCRVLRNPSRSVSRAERGCARLHALAKLRVPTPPREGMRLSTDLGCFPPIVPSRAVESRPSARLAWSVRHAAPEGHCERETDAFSTTSGRLALTSQACRRSSVCGSGESPFVLFRPGF